MAKRSKATKESVTISSKKLDEELEKAIERMEQLEKDTGRTYYVLQSTKWKDVFFVSPIDTLPNAILI